MSGLINRVEPGMYRVSRNFPGTWNVLPVRGQILGSRGLIRTIPESGGTGKKTEWDDLA